MIYEDTGIAGECIQNKGRYKKTMGKRRKAELTSKFTSTVSKKNNILIPMRKGLQGRNKINLEYKKTKTRKSEMTAQELLK
jgi:hypothetical protein